MFNSTLIHDQTSPQWLRELRQQGFAEFQKIGLPTLHNETWKYTNINILSKKEFQLATRD